MSRNFNKSRQSGLRHTLYSVSDYGEVDEETSFEDEKGFQKTQLCHTDTEASFKSITHHDHTGHKFYRPTSNRTWVMCAFLAVVGLCIVLLELAIATHGSAHEVANIRTRAITVDHTPWFWLRQARTKREAEAAATIATVTSQDIAAISLREAAPTASEDAASTTPTVPDTAAESHTTTVSGQPAPVNQVTITSSAETTPSIETVSNPQNEATITSEDSPNVTIAPNPNNQVTITSSSDHGTTVGEPNPVNQVTVTSESVPFSPDPGRQATVTSQHDSETTPEPQTYTGGGDPESLMTVTPTPAYSPASDQVLTVTQDNGKVVISTEQGQVNTAQAVSSAAAAASVVSGSILVSSGQTLATLPASQTVQSAGVTVLTRSNGAVTTSVAESLAVSVFTGTNGVVTTSTIVAAVAGLGVVTLTDTNGKATATVGFTGNVVYTDANGAPTMTVSYTQAPKSTAGISSAGSNIFGNLNTSNKVHPMTQFDYFCAIYLPTLVAIGIQSAWLVVFSSFKTMEPFYQLARPGGAVAASSLTADYLSCGISFTFVKAAFDGHWVMCLAGMVQLFMTIIVSLASRAFKVVPTAYCKTPIADRQPCNPVWIVNFPATRAVEVLLVACFSMIVALTWLNRRRVSGVYSDPTRIATIADLTIHKPLVQEIRDLPPSATKQQIEIDLAESRYMLGTFDAYGKQHYGIIKLETLPQREFTRQASIKVAFDRFNSWAEITYDNINKDWPLLPDFLSIASTVILFSLIFAYMLIPGKDHRPFNNFMNSGQFGPGFLLTIHAVLISTLIKRKERLLRLSHPYVLLSKSPSKPASQTITAGIHGTQFDSIWKSFTSGDFMLAFLSLAAFFSDMVIVLVPGIPWTQAQTAPVYQASTYTCLALLGILFTVQVYIVFDEWRRRDMLQYDCPETLASVLMRLCASRFVEEKNMHAGALGDKAWEEQGGRGRHSSFTNFFPEFGTDDEQKQKVRYEGINDVRRYEFSCMEGVDGVHRFMVDEDMHGRR